MNALEEIANRQIALSTTANQLKRVLDLTRNAVFGLSIAGALLATVAGQTDGKLRWWSAMAGAAALAAATFLSARLLGATHVSDWVRARAAAEALKREAFKCAAAATPYVGEVPARAKVLNAERKKIEQSVIELIGLEVTPSQEQIAKSGTPREAITPDEYVERRLRRQASYYETHAEQYRRRAAVLGWIEFTLALTATIVTGIVGSVDKPSLPAHFDFVALAAVLTTVSGAIVAHVEAARYAFLITTYRATARRLLNEIAETEPLPDQSSKDWSDFVERCEAIIAEENGGWLAKWTKATEPSPQTAPQT